MSEENQGLTMEQAFVQANQLNLEIEDRVNQLEELYQYGVKSGNMDQQLSFQIIRTLAAYKSALLLFEQIEIPEE